MASASWSRAALRSSTRPSKRRAATLAALRSARRARHRHRGARLRRVRRSRRHRRPDPELGALARARQKGGRAARRRATSSRCWCATSRKDRPTSAANRRRRSRSRSRRSLRILGDVERHAPEGKVVRGTVTRLLDFGAFVQLDAGRRGLLHVSELGGKVAHPSAALKVGEQTQRGRALGRQDRAQDRAGIGRGRLVARRGGATPSFVVGAIVQGIVDRIETYGLFLQIDGTRGRVGRGLIPNAELGTPRGSDMRKLFPPGTKLTAKVLETGEGKLRLSIKGGRRRRRARRLRRLGPGRHHEARHFRGPVQQAEVGAQQHRAVLLATRPPLVLTRVMSPAGVSHGEVRDTTCDA